MASFVVWTFFNIPDYLFLSLPGLMARVFAFEPFKEAITILASKM